jgi:hypothetical protein
MANASTDSHVVLRKYRWFIWTLEWNYERHANSEHRMDEDG